MGILGPARPSLAEQFRVSREYNDKLNQERQRKLQQGIIPQDYIDALAIENSGYQVQDLPEPLSSQAPKSYPVIVNTYPNMASQFASKASNKTRRRKNKVKGPRRNRAGAQNSSIIQAPAAGGVILRRGNYPIIRSSNSGRSTVICNTEPLTNITTAVAGAFVSQRNSLTTFALSWLSGIATSFSKFRWIKLRLIYIPIVPTSTTGQVVFHLGYDANDATPGSVTEAQTAYRATTQPVWGGYEGSYLLNADTFPVPSSGSVYVDLDVGRAEEAYYPIVTQATFNAAAAGIQNTYQPAYLDTVTQGGPTLATSIGTIFAKYEVELIEPSIAARNV